MIVIVFLVLLVRLNWVLNYNQDNFLGPLKFSSEVYGKYNSFVNSADAGTTNEEFSFQYGASTLISAPPTLKEKVN